MKVCNKCYETKKHSDFYRKPTGGLVTICKQCKNAAQREWHHKMSRDVTWRARRSEKNKARYHQKKSPHWRQEQKEVLKDISK